MRLGLVGYGAGGRIFHAPYIQAVPEIELAGVVTGNPDRRREVATDLPGAPVFDSSDDLLAGIGESPRDEVADAQSILIDPWR